MIICVPSSHEDNETRENQKYEMNDNLVVVNIEAQKEISQLEVGWEGD